LINTKVFSIVLYNNAMNYRLFFISILLFVSVSVHAQTDSTRLVWPSPPDRARIKHLLTISSLNSFEAKKGFFSGIFGFLFGDEKTSHWLVQPLGIAVSSKNKLYITDPGAKGVHVIDQTEKEYDFLSETKYGTFQSPVGCAISDAGTIFISDSQRGDIVALDEDHDALFEIKEHLVRPTGIKIHGDKLYVADASQHAILIYDLKGKFISRFGERGSEPGMFNFPVDLAVNDSLMVVDALNYRIQKFDLTGKAGTMFGRQGNVAGRFASPKNIALDSDGNIYVSDALMDCIQIFNTKGELLLIVGKNGTGNGEFVSPNGIAIDSNDKIYVVESLNRRIQIFQYIK